MPHPLRNRLILGGRPITYLLRATFGATQGFVVDQHGTNHLTASGSPTATTGKVGSAAQLVAASSQYFSVADNADLSMGDIDFTIGAWVYVDSLSSTMTIMAKGVGPNAADMEFWLGCPASGVWFFEVSNGTTKTGPTYGGTAASTGQWYFVVAWHDSAANTVNIQVNNGVVYSAAHTVGSWDSTNTFRLGFEGASRYFNGRIDQPFVTKRVLTAQERTDLYNSGNGLAYSALTAAHKVSLVSWWEFEPLPASLPVDVGGVLTTVQVDGQLSQSGGKLVFPAQTTPTFGDQGMYENARSRVAGRALFGILRLTTMEQTFLAWSSAATLAFSGFANVTQAFYTNGASSLIAVSAGVASGILSTISTATDYELAIVLRSTGAFYLVRGGVFTSWTLVWVSNTGSTATLYPAFSNYAAAGTLDNFRVLDLVPLDARFATDYGPATSRLTSPAAGATTTSTADAVIEIVTNVMSASTSHIYLRKQDASNTWRISYNSGLFSLVEVVAGVPATRASDATANANGTRFVVVMEGNVIKGYSNNTLRWTYSSATNFQTATGVEVLTLNGSITELVCWPRTLSLPGNM